MPTQADVQKWLDTVDTVVQPDGNQQLALEQVVGNAGLAVLLGLMMATRQGLYAQLAGIPLSTEPGRYQAAIIQGQIRSIDLLPQTLLDQFPTAPADPANSL